MDRAEVKSSLTALDADDSSARVAVDDSGRLWTRDDTPIPTPVATTDTSEADTAQTVSTPSTGPRRILYVLVAYSAAPTQAGVTITLNSTEGAGFDTVLHAGDANDRYTFFQPSGDLVLQDGDTLDVTAPAAGGVITSSVLIASVA